MELKVTDTDLDRELNAEMKSHDASAPPKQAEATGGGPLSNPRFRRALVIGGVIIIVAAIAGYWYLSGRVSTDDAEVDGHLNPVSAKISGNIAEVLVNDNQAIHAGQVLVKIDPRDFQARVDQARAALTLAEAQAHAANVTVPYTQEVTESGRSGAGADMQAALADQARARQAYQMATTSDLALAQANVAKKQATADRAKADLERMRPLAAKAEISQQQFDSFVAEAGVAQSDLEAQKQKLAQAQQNVAIVKSQLDAANARVGQAQAGTAEANANFKQVTIRSADAAAAAAAVEQARANLATAQLQLSYTIIVASVDGVVTHKSVEVGQVVEPGQGLVILVPLQDVWVTANFKETQLAGVHAGQRAEIHVDMYGKTFIGHVDSIAGATGSRLSLLPPENATGNFVKVVQRIPVKIVLDPVPPDQAVLRPGMNVDATIILH
ncbi:MAG: HlyD family secretion protein [Candidatus Acidiferrales bacterium]